MSRIGKNPVQLPAKVKATLSGRTLTVEGPKGTLSHEVHEAIDVVVEDNAVVFTRGSDAPSVRALHGTQRALTQNMVKGVTEGFKREMEIIGVGYRGEQKGKAITLFLGFSHPVNYNPPEGVTVKMDGTNKVVVEGIDRQMVGQVAAEIRGFKEPEPYKGKGIKYVDEVIRRKAGKKSG